MSHGNVSPLLRPIDPKIILKTCDIYGKHAADIAIQLDGCQIETLLFVSLVHQFTEAKKGYFYDLQFSVLRHDNTGKMQTPEMRLVHDVRVELGMAGRQYKRLIAFFEAHNLAFCRRHSCGDQFTLRANEDAWYDQMEQDQMNRTWLDWEGTHTMVDCFGCLSKKCIVPSNLRSIYDQIFDGTVSVLSNSGYNARLPTLADFQKAA